MIQIWLAARRFNAFSAVKNLSFDAHDRATNGVLGANGAVRALVYGGRSMSRHAVV